MSFSIINPDPDARYKWDFGDGRQTEDWLGRTIHCYLQSGLFNVTVQEIPKNERDGVRTASRLASAHIIWSKTQPANETRILNTLLKDDLSKADIGHLMNGYRLAQQLKKEQSDKFNLKETFRTPLLNRIGEYRPEDAAGALHLAGDCKNLELRNYGKSLEICNRLISVLPSQNPLRAEALIEGAEILINCYGQDEAGLALLDQLSNAPLNRDQTVRAGLLRAAAMMPQQPAAKILELIRTITPRPDARNELLTGINSLGNIRHARMLVTEYPADSVQLTFAMEKLDQLIIQNPDYYILPELNLIKLDIYLNRMEYERADQLSRRLLHLELSESVRPEIIARQIWALYGLNRKDQAQELVKTLTEQYPYSPAAAAVKKLQKKK